MRRPGIAFAFAGLAGPASLAACSSHADQRTVRVAAAADLQRAFTELGPAFTAQTGITPRFDFGSSGLLAKRIEQGAPYFLFAAANRGYVDQVVHAGKCDGASVASYAQGWLVVWTPDGIAPPATLAELTAPRFRRIAIANPDHAPYGAAAKQALTAAGLWSQLADKLVIGGDNIDATLQYARTGAADVALVARSLVTATVGGSALAVDPALHEPLDQSLVVCGTGAEADAARQLAQFIASDRGRAVMTHYGFTLPATGGAR